MITESDLQFKTKEEVAEIILAMQKIIVEKDTVIADKNKTIEYLCEQFRLSRYKRFGNKSEKDLRGARQLSLFDEATTPDNTPEIIEADEELTIPEHTRKKKGRKSLPKHLPRKQEVYDLPETEKTCSCSCSCSCGCALTYIGDEVSEQLEIIPMKVYIIEHVRKEYACRGCEETIKQARMPKQPIPKSIAAPGLLAHTLVSKFEDHLPLYRQEHILQCVGIDIPRATLSHWVIKAETKSYMWVLGGGPPDKFALVYHYAPSRAHTVPLDLLEDFKGYLHCDGYQAYDFIGQQDKHYTSSLLVSCAP